MRVLRAGFGVGLLCLTAGVFTGRAGGQERAAVPNEPAAASAAMGGRATVTYQFDRPGLVVPRFQVLVREDGTGRYEAEEAASGLPGTQTGEGQAGTGQTGTGQTGAAGGRSHVKREITISPAATAKIFKVARTERFFGIACASKAKNIADTGTKTLIYEGPDGRGSCTYNYTEKKEISMLTDLFLGIATTLDEGRKLEFKRRYDRLGLDAELDALAQASESGRAVELGTIAPLLRELASDTEMMQRVRLRAAKLLDRAADGR